MKLEHLCIAALTLLLSPLASSRPAADEWTWVLGHLGDQAQQEEYAAFAERMYGFYQGRGQLVGPLVDESELDSPPGERSVFLGPLEAFEHRDWLEPLLASEGPSAARIGDLELDAPRTGIFLRDAGQTRLLYTGLSLQGFMDIFSVPTGNHACTVTQDGAIRHQGDWSPGGLVLETLAFLPTYPTVAEIADLAASEQALVAEAVYADKQERELAPAFAARLRALVAEQRVLFVGESHWNTGVNQLFDRILELLLAEGRVRAVFLELNFSFGAFFDHYVHLADEAEAERFLAKELHPLVQMEGTLVHLRLLRAHNLAHPERAVRVACLDLEWSSSTVVEHVIEPYFQRLDPDFRLTAILLSSKKLRAEKLARMRELLVVAAERDTEPTYPFLTPTYVEQVLANLEDTLGLEDFDRQRQVAIARNITEFNAELLDEGLAIFKGGSYHAVKRRQQGEPYLRDAAHLDLEYAPTRGRVATLLLRGVGYGFADIAPLDLKRRMSSATNYNDFARDFQRDLAQGLADPGAFYLLDGGHLNVFEQLAIRTGYVLGRDVLWLKETHPELLAPQHAHGADGDPRLSYDEAVFVLRAQLERTRPRSFEGR